MGAIAGLLPHPEVGRERLVARLDAMRERMRRRAPVDGGRAVARDGTIGLFHAGGTGPGAEAVLQPLRNESGSLWLVADGEPSNAAALRLELIGAGHRFQSTCGSEVILHLYEQDGVAALERLAGTFAFALWDREQRELILGRDRFGERPLHVAATRDGFAFASEAHAVVPEGDGVDPAAVTAFLSLGYLPAGHAATTGVRALEPGGILRVRDGRLRDERLWLEPSEMPSGRRDADRARLGCLLRESVEAGTDGEDGVALVLDDSPACLALLLLARPVLGRSLRTHRLGFGPAGVPAARSPWSETVEHEHVLGPQDLARAFTAAADHDRPSVEAPRAELIAAALRARHERVWLAPLTLPELFGPGETHAVRWRWRLGRHASVRAIARTGATLLWRVAPFTRPAVTSAHLACGGSVARAYLGAVDLCGPAALAALLRPEVLAASRAAFDLDGHLHDAALRPRGPGMAPEARSAREAIARAVASLELAGPMMAQALRDAESAAAAHGLALRAPFLEHRLWELVAGGGLHDRGAALVRLLGRGAPHRLPAAAPSAPPLDTWMRGALRGLIGDTLLADDRDALFHRRGLERLWRGFLARRVGWRPVWAVAVLRAWLAAHRTGTRPRRARGTARHAA